MIQLDLHTIVYKYDSFAEFAEKFHLGKGDLIFTNEFLYTPKIAPLHLECDVYYQEQYGEGEPTDVMYNAIMKDLRGKDYKRVIGVGGGTVIDMAKWVASEMPEDIVDAYKVNPTFAPKHNKELILIPTTCGTGSEVTNIALVYLTREQTKKGCANDELYADYAVLIPDMVRSLPYDPFMFSAIDALIHAVESYVGKYHSDMTQMFGRRAITFLMGGFKEMLEHGPEARLDHLDEFVLGSNYAGIAFGTAGCNLVHAMSFPLGGMFKVPHGESNYALFTTVMKWYYKQKPDGVIREVNHELAGLLGCRTEGEEVYDELEKALARLIRRKPLREYGVTRDDVETMADLVVTQQQRLLNKTYVPVKRDTIRDLYLKVL